MIKKSLADFLNRVDENRYDVIFFITQTLGYTALYKFKQNYLD